MDKASHQGGNESLTYTAPKQPKKKGPEVADTGSAPAVVVATVVHAYKLVDGHYSSQGKLGATILANHSSKDYRILLYVSKQKQVTNARITTSFTYSIQPNNYASFYDEGRINWSVMFDKEETALQFAKQVALAKANSAGPGMDSVITQDLVLGEGGQLDVGDSAEIQYTGWFMTNGTFGQMFDSNVNSEKLFRFKLGKGKVIKGWESGILGMKKGAKRLLIVPPHLGYGSQGKGDKIPANSTLIFDVNVVRVKLLKGDFPSDSSADTPTPVSSDTGDGAWDTESVKDRSKSISEQLSQSPKTDKAKLISRMAKMGQPMLPMSGAIPAQVDDDELTHDMASLESPQHSEHHVKPALARKPELNQTSPQVIQQPVVQPVEQPVQQPMAQMMNQAPPQYQTMQGQPAFLQNLPAAQQLSVYQPTNLLQQQQQAAMLQQQNMAAGLQQPNFQQPAMVPGQQYAGVSFLGGVPPATATSQPSTVDTLVPVLLSETRQQNTEVRLSVSKMSDKVDRILEKVDHLAVHGPGSALAQTSLAPTMETGVLLQNITRIVQENETLKKDVFEKSGKIEAQNDKIAELLQKNQRFAEQSNTLLEERNVGYKLSADQSQAKVLALEQEKVKLTTELGSVSSDLSNLQLEIANIRKSEAETKQKLKTAEDLILKKEEEYNRIKLQALNDEKKMSELVSSLRAEKQQRKSLESQLNQTQEELGDMKTSQQSLERNLSERKRKANEERRKLEEDMEDLKMNLESEIQSLRDRLRKQKTSVDVSMADRISKLEEDIGQEWQEKCDKLLKSAEEKHNRIVRDLEEEKETLQQKIKELESKIQVMRSSTGTSEQLISQLQDKVEDLAVWKDKYDNLRSQATSMKERYEERISDLEEERDSILDKGRQLQIQNQHLQQSLSQAQTHTVPSSTSDTSANVATEVKKIMNNVYRSLREEFDSEESYMGSEILAIILNAIKTTTLSLMNATATETAPKEEEDEENEEEDDEEEEVEHEEEDKTEASKEQTSEVKKTEDKVNSETVVKPEVVITMSTPEVSEVSEVVKSTVHHAAEASPSNITASNRGNEQTLDQIEPVIESSVSPSVGDHGNRYYSNTLNKLEGSSITEYQTSVTETGKDEKPTDDLEKAIEPVIDCSWTFETGDHGNRSYTSKLDNSAASSAGETVGKSSTFEIVGSPQNIQCGERLDETNNQTEEKIQCSSSFVTGDQGNTSYSKTLDKLVDRPAVVEEIFESSNLQGLGDLGNPSHREKLNKLKSETEVPFQTIDDYETATDTNTNTESELTEMDEKSSLQVLSFDEQKSGEQEKDNETSISDDNVTKEISDHPGSGDGDTVNKTKSDTIMPACNEKDDVKEMINEDVLSEGAKEKIPELNSVDRSDAVDVTAIVKEIKTDSKDVRPDSKEVVSDTNDIVSDLSDAKSFMIIGDTGDSTPDSESDKTNISSPAEDAKSDKTNKVSDQKEAITSERLNSMFDSDDVPLAEGNKSSNKSEFPDPDRSLVQKDTEQIFLQSEENFPVDPLGGLANGSVANSTLLTSKDRSISSASNGKSMSGSSSVKSDSLPTLAGREPPPLFDDDDDDDIDDSELFGSNNVTADTSVSKEDTKQSDNKDSTKSKLPSKTELVDDSKPAPPPPLFGDDDDDDDLDWLS